MTEVVKLHNTSTDMQAEVKSADGDSIMLLPEAKIEVDVKFNWNLPKGVVIYRPKDTVFGKKTREVATKQVVDIEENRKTINSDVITANPTKK